MKSSNEQSPKEISGSIAIAGMSCLFPKARNTEEFWSNIRNGVDAITEIPTTHWDPKDFFDGDPKSPDMTYARRGGFLSPVPFDPLEFGVSPRDIEATDTTQLLGLVAAKRALDDAGYKDGGRELPRDRTSVILGVTGTLELVIPLGARLGHPIWKKALKDAGVDPETASDVVERISNGYVGWQENSFPGLLGNVAAGRIANRLDLGGTNCVVDAACASSLSAVHLACLELLSGRSDVVLSGGLDTFNDIFMYMCFSKTPALSASGNAKPFSAAGDGTILGEGIGVVVLKRLEDAERDGDRIYGVIKSLASSSDGKGNAVYAPVAEGQEKALRRSYEMGGVTPDSIEMVEAHGTGTKVGDATEVKALSKVYREAGEGSWCALGSVKSQIGHTKAAAGAAGLIKTALALYNKVLPPTIKVEQPHEAVAPGTTPFYVNTAKRPWPGSEEHPRRAALSAFGFGGSNFHCLLEEYQPLKAEPDWDGAVQLVPVSGKAEGDLTAALKELQALESWDDLRLKAADLRNAFDASSSLRLVMVLDRDADWKKIIGDCLTKVAQNVTSAWSVSGKAVFGTGEAGKLGILFPGQGSQRVNMMRDLACQFPEVLAALEGAENVRESGEGRLTDVLYPQPAFDDATKAAQDDALRSTDKAQPALGVAGLGGWKLLQRFGVQSDFYAGHSYGELVALCASGRISEDDFHKISRLRGNLMAEAGRASGGGTMTAIRLGASEVSELLSKHSLKAVIANINAKDQVVIAGTEADVAEAEAVLEKQGTWFKRLPVAASFHSALVADAAKPFTEALSKVKFEKGSNEVFANTTAKPYPATATACRKLLGEQLANPVDFVGILDAIKQEGVTTFIEVGAGTVLSGLVKSTMKGQGVQVMNLESSRGKKNGVQDLAWLLAELAASGHSLKLDEWDAGAAEKLEVITVKKGRMTIPISGANYRAPYDEKPPTVRKPTPAIAPVASAPAAQGASVASPISKAPAPAPFVTPKPVTPVSKTNMNPDSLNSALNETREAFAALQRLQEQTANLHHQFLLGQEKAQQTLSAIVTRQNSLLGDSGLAPAPAPVAQAPAAPVAPVSQVPKAPAPKPVTAPVPTPEPKTPSYDRTMNRDELVKAARTSEPVVGRIAAAVPSEGNAEKVEKALLEVVSEKTGYPMEMLNLDMGLDSDLGIDSIKRVEIMSALQDKLPDAPEVKPSDLGSLETLRQVADFLSDGMPEPVASPSRVSAAPAAPAVGVDTSKVASVLLEVVSEKTGYPPEMLNLEMGLDSDLGIDSIKRVEIMSALQDKLPDAPEVKPSDLGALETLQQVVDFLAVPSAGGVVAESAPAVAGPGLDAISPVLLEVVAEKTGYPTEMLNLDMGLDSDLGIDSIKRVEIMSALQERLPDAPEVKPSDLGALETLRQVAEFLAGPAGSASAPATQAPAAAGPAIDQVSGVLLDVVSEKTGYPKEMLNLDMQMDSDLGIDSIKRVEIMSSLQERLPNAQEVKPNDLGALQTLQQVAEFLAGNTGQAAPAVAAPVAQEAEDLPPILSQVLERQVLQSIDLGEHYTEEVLSLKSGSLVWLVGEDSKTRKELAKALESRGLKVEAKTLSKALSTKSVDGLAGLILLAQGDAMEKGSLLKAFQVAQKAAPALASSAGNALFASVSILDGAFGLNQLKGDAFTGGLAGLVKTASHEWEGVHCKAIDVEPASSVDASKICQEFFRGGPIEVGLSKAGRNAIQLEQLSFDPANEVTPLVKGDVVIVSGGSRGVTAETVVAIAEAYQPTLVLLGRSPEPEVEPAWLRGLTRESDIKKGILENMKGKPDVKKLEKDYRRWMANREILHNIQRMEATGAKAIYRSVDIRDARAISKMVDKVRKDHGPIRGLIHGAGVLADRRIEDKTTAQFELVYSTKVDGIQALLKATRKDPLRIIAFFSSFTGRYGRTGQVDYAIANEVLNKVAHVEALARPECRVISANWGPWNGGMVNDGLRKIFEAEGVGLIEPSAGAEYLVKELSQKVNRSAPVEVVVLAPASSNSELTKSILPSLPSKVEEVAKKAAPVRPASDGDWKSVMDRTVSVAEFPCLASHVIKGKAVLPAALMSELLGHGALHGNPGEKLAGFQGFQVMKGLTLDATEEATVTVESGALSRVEGQAVVPMRLVSRNGDKTIIHAQGDVILGSADEGAPSILHTFGADERGPKNLYTPDGLFHLNHFQGILSMIGCDEEGFAARVAVAPKPKDWIANPWRSRWTTDPMIIDCIYQLMIVWSQKHNDAPCLPSKVELYEQFASFPKGEVEIRAQITKTGRRALVADVEILGPEGELVARMKNCQSTVAASLKAAFKENVLA